MMVNLLSLQVGANHDSLPILYWISELVHTDVIAFVKVWYSITTQFIVVFFLVIVVIRKVCAFLWMLFPICGGLCTANVSVNGKCCLLFVSYLWWYCIQFIDFLSGFRSCSCFSTFAVAFCCLSDSIELNIPLCKSFIPRPLFFIVSSALFQSKSPCNKR